MSEAVNLDAIYEWAINEKIINEEIDYYSNSQRGLPKDKDKLLEIKCLNLSSFNLDDIYEEIFNLTQLEELILCDNNIKSIPSEIGNLQNLKWLNIAENCLTSLPPEICNLTQLESLELMDNNITEINSYDLERLTQLKMFYLDLTVNIRDKKDFINNLEDSNRKENQV